MRVNVLLAAAFVGLAAAQDPPATTPAPGQPGVYTSDGVVFSNGAIIIGGGPNGITIGGSGGGVIISGGQQGTNNVVISDNVTGQDGSAATGAPATEAPATEAPEPTTTPTSASATPTPPAKKNNGAMQKGMSWAGAGMLAALAL